MFQRFREQRVKLWIEHNKVKVFCAGEIHLIRFYHCEIRDSNNNNNSLPVAVVVDLVAEVVEAEPAAGSAAAEPLEVETFWLLFLPEFYERLLLWDARLVGCWPGFVLIIN